MKKLFFSLLFLCTPLFVLAEAKNDQYRAPEVAQAQTIDGFFEQLIAAVKKEKDAGKKNILVVMLLEMLMKEPDGLKEELMALEQASQEQQQEMLVMLVTKLYYTFELNHEKIPQYIQTLQDMGVTLVGITAADPMISTKMIERLHHLGIHFENSTLIDEDLKIASKDAASWYSNGILFSNNLNLVMPGIQTLLQDAQFKPDAQFYLLPVTQQPAQQ